MSKNFLKVIQNNWVLLVLFIIVLAFFYQFIFKGLLPIPSDTIIGLYHPFRDLYRENYPNGIPYKNFLITDPVRQIIPWKDLALNILKNGSLPLWNPYEMAGKPLLGNFQSSPFYPLNILLVLFPFSVGWSIMILLQPLLAGFFLYLYLKKMKLHSLAALLGSITFSFSGFFISWLEWNAVLHTALWLPLILYIKEILLEKFSLRWAFLLIFVECSAVFAGHLQTLVYSLIISNAYLFIRMYQVAKDQNRKRIIQTMGKLYLPFLGIGIVMYLLTTILWVPTLQYILLSARSLDQSEWTKPGWFIPWQHLIQFVAPDFFGNPTTLNYWGTWNYAELVGYIGIFPLMMSLYAFFFRRDRMTLFFGSLFFLSLIFSLPTFFAKLPYVLQIPFLSTAQPTRLLFITDFSLAILAGLGFDLLLRREKKRRIISVIAFFLVVFLFIWGFIFVAQSVGISSENISIARKNVILPTVLIVLFSLLLILFIRNYKKHLFITILSFVLLGISAFDLLRFGWKFTPFTKQEYFFPNTKTIEFLKKQEGLFRIASTDSRILPPNFSTYYRIESIEGYDPLYLRSYAEFIAALERGKPDISPPFGFNRIITPHNVESKLIDLLNVKYVLSLSDLNSPKFNKVFQEGQTSVYENTQVLPRTFLVRKIVYTSSSHDVYAQLFEHDLSKVAIVESSMTFKDELLPGGSAEILKYSENQVIIKTKTSGTGFLVLTDTYYPTWRAIINGSQYKIFKTNGAFRGIPIPAGEYTVTFENKLF